MKRKLTVTIGIPSYNEEQNIGRLLNSLLEQNQKYYILKKILVISDKSIDKTNEIVSNIKSEEVQLIVNKKKIGQNASQNLITKLAYTDLLILFEADILPTSNSYLDNLVTMYMQNKKLKLIYGRRIGLPGNSKVGKSIAKQKEFYEKFVNYKVSEKDTTGRGGRLLTKSLYKKFKWPDNVPEDAFLHAWCLQNKIDLAYCSEASCYYQLPSSARDFRNEIYKAMMGQETLYKYFNNMVINKIFSNTELTLLKKLIFFMNFLVKHPINCLLYIYLRCDFWIHKIYQSNSSLKYFTQNKTTKFLLVKNNYK